MTSYVPAIDEAQSKLIRDLIGEGFVVTGARSLRGTIQWVDRGGETHTSDLDVTIQDSYPFLYPRVRPLKELNWSWHLDADGGLCLWERSEATSDLPWAHTPILLDRIRLWLREDAAGWPDDPPDLDLERYVPSDPGMFIYQTETLENALGGAIRNRRRRHSRNQR